ncbi:MAG TPA: hypothetical protein VHL09_04705, partial [Dehalococcoidia bacterium]|nr:hypothetical protein [Dehalococcoidia bacterium]
MPLDYDNLAAQVGTLRESLIQALGRRTENLGAALQIYGTPREPWDWFSERIEQASSDWRHARPLEPPATLYSPEPVPAEFIVVATDGSQIEADRHYGIECHLLNFGLITLRYGAYASGRLDVTSQILIDDDLYIANPDKPADRQKLEGQLLAAKRAILELEEVFKLAAASPDGLPVLALQDGTLTLWNLLGSQHRQFVSRALL